MITINRKQEEILYAALDLWGPSAQLFMLVEETGELLSAIGKWQRGRIGPEEVIEEIADVYIMLMQTYILVGDNKSIIDDVITKKIARLRRRIMETVQ